MWRAGKRKEKKSAKMLMRLNHKLKRLFHPGSIESYDAEIAKIKEFRRQG
jgi:hypothetical protein